MNDKIKLINHSSVQILNEKISILTDPWYFGSAFNNGWSLLYENSNDEIIEALTNTNFIFISHEHPDHFSIQFFKKYRDIIKSNKIRIIFQATKDMRVENFLKSMDLKLINIKHKEKFFFDNLNNLTLIKQGHIDSAFLYETENKYHLNINDCNFIDSEINEIKTLIKNKKKEIILYIQFSYASFRPDDEWLKRAAEYKLNNISKYWKSLNISMVIPYASFFHFSHSENQNLKKYANNCKTLSNFLNKQNIKFCILNPKQNLTNIDTLITNESLRLKINNLSQIFWDSKIKDAKINFYEKPREQIKEDNIKLFSERLKKYNNFYFFFLIRFISFKKIFGDLYVKINNSNEIYLLNFHKIKKMNNKNIYDFSISSEAFNLLLNQPFGIETLLVSGRLKSHSKNSMRKLTSYIGIFTINLSGYGINFRDISKKLIFNKIKGLIFRAVTQRS